MVPPTPSFADWLPGSILVGVGLGMAYATFAGVTVSGLTPETFGLGSGVSAIDPADRLRFRCCRLSRTAR
jgi:hypothetical protein